SKIHLKAQ
ncbi:lipoprotein, putative, partial [Vibrio cholerae O1 str. NHCC-010F]